MLSPGDRLRAIEAYKNGTLSISWWPNTKYWAKEQGWPTPFFGWKKAFIEKMLESDENFEKALIESSIDVYISS